MLASMSERIGGIKNATKYHHEDFKCSQTAFMVEHLVMKDNRAVLSKLSLKSKHVFFSELV